MAELTRQAERQGVGVEDLLPRELWEISCTLVRVLDLADSSVLEAIHVDAPDLVREDRSLTRDIGESAYEQGFEAIRSRSAAGVDEIVAVFPENLPGTELSAELLNVWEVIADFGR